MRRARYCRLIATGLLCSSLVTGNVAATTINNPPAYLQALAGPSVTANNIFLMEEYVRRYQQAVFYPWPALPTQVILKSGMHHSLIPLLRERLMITGDLPMGTDTLSARYDQTIISAVITFQTRMGLNPDGILGPETLKALNVSPAKRLQQLMINLQRWQALSAQLGERFVMVNIPAFRLYVYEKGHKIFDMKAIVGKTSRKTPEITSRITRLVFNPPWNVPKLIIKKDIVPKMLANPDYLNDTHMRIFTSPENNAEEISPDAIDWDAVSEEGFPWHLRQDPGNDNALGRVKFEFQNDANIYLHDTPAKSLFDSETRTFSSGCIRLEHPFELVNYLMKSDPRWNDLRLQSLLDEEETVYLRAPESIPIFITYITAWVDEKGVLNFRNDVYGEDLPNPDNNKDQVETD